MRRDFEFNHAAQKYFLGLKVGELFSSNDRVQAGVPHDILDNRIDAWLKAMQEDKFIEWTGRKIKDDRPGQHQVSVKEWVRIK